MYNYTPVIGVDPGLRTTGLVMFLPRTHHSLEILSLAVDHSNPKDEGLIAEEIQQALMRLKDEARFRTSFHSFHVAMEDFRPRPGMSTTSAMISVIALVKTLLKQTPEFKVSTLNNMGIKKVVRPATLKLLGLDKWETSTHHDDLTSAARIALFHHIKEGRSEGWLFNEVLQHHECLFSPNSHTPPANRRKFSTCNCAHKIEIPWPKGKKP